MKKLRIILLILIMIFTCFMCFSACKQQENSDTSTLGKAFSSERFQILERHTDLGKYCECIIYDTQTGVEYLYIYSGYKGAITPLYNTDGTLMIAPNWND